jgi:hypothetical protein
LLKLLEYEEDLIYGEVAFNPSAPLEALRTLAIDDDEHIRWRVAFNQSTSLEILEILACDEHPDTRKRVAMHPNISLELAKSLMKDSEERVRREAKISVDCITNPDSEEAMTWSLRYLRG